MMKARNKFFLFLTLLSTFVFAKNEGYPQINHFTFIDSVSDYKINIQAQLADSVVITNLSNAPTHYDNSMSIRLFLNGYFTKNLWFNSKIKVSTDYTNRDIAFNYYTPHEGIPFNKQNEHKRTWDIFSANINYKLKPFTLMAGYDYLEWGPSRRNHVILRGEKNIYRPWQDSSSRIFDVAPTPYFGYQFNIGIFTYTQYSAKLFEKKNANKYIHLHRLDLNLPKSITLGLSETSLYGTSTESNGTNPNSDADSCEREFEWAYVIPFIPYVFQEHLQGDKDNISLAFDLSIKTIPHTEFYGELLWDDMKSPTSMFDDDWWGNKWATTIGFALDKIKFGSFIFDLMTEYTRIEPWVYTHHKGGGYTYASYAQNLGSDLGPNSREIHTELSSSYSFLKLTLLAGNVAKDTAFGGNINDIHGPNDQTDKKFLNNKTTLHYTEIGGILSLAPFDWMNLRLGYTRFFKDYKGFRAYATGTLQW